MIRKTIIVVLTAGAVSSGVLWVVSYPPRSWAWFYRNRAQTVEIMIAGGQGCSFRWNRDWPEPRLIAKLIHGKLHLSYHCPVSPEDLAQPARGEIESVGEDISFAGFQAGGRIYKRQRLIRFIALPLWLPFVLFTLYPILAFIRGPVRRYRRRKRGLCVKCAYDLRGNVSGTCPECSTEIKRP